MTDPNQPDQPETGLPQYPSAPDAGLPSQPTYQPPTEIVAAYWCYIVGAVITAAGGLFVLTQRSAILAATRAANTSNLSDSTIQSVVSFVVGFAVVLSLIFAVLYAFLAFKLRAGRNWARIVLTVVAALALLALVFGGAGASILRVVGDLAAVAGAVLSYLPNSSTYFAAMKRVN